MEKLRDEISVKKYITELRGYLAALSHLNDQIGYRHGFSADLVSLNGRDAISVAKEYLEDSAAEFAELSLREETEIITKYIFNNFNLGAKMHDVEKLNFIKEQFVWHIQDYFTLVELDVKLSGRWVHRSKDDNNDICNIFYQFGDQLALMSFGIRKEKGKSNEIFDSRR